jgi:hypothetical protein
MLQNCAQLKKDNSPAFVQIAVHCRGKKLKFQPSSTLLVDLDKNDDEESGEVGVETRHGEPTSFAGVKEMIARAIGFNTRVVTQMH